MTKKINIGVLGGANIAKRSIIPTILELDDYFELKVVASRSESKAKEFSNLFKVKGLSGYDELIHYDGLEAVYIPLPNALHFQWIQKALNNGLHVLVEKSLACTYEEVVELNRMAKERNLVLMENFQFRFHSQLKFLTDMVNKGKIGELRNIRSSFGFPPFPDQKNIRYDAELGGGALLDCGAYPIKVSQIFLGPGLIVKASDLVIDENKGVDLWGSAYLKQSKGNVTSQISFGFDNFYQCNIELWGSKGKLYTNRVFTAGPGIAPQIEFHIDGKQETVQLEADNHFANMLLHFYHLVKTGNKLEQEYEQNIEQARLITEVKKKSNEQ